MTKANQLSQGYSITLCAAVVLSTTGIFIRYLTQTYHLPALVLAFWRDVFVVLTLLVALGLLRPNALRMPRGQVGYLALYGFALAVFNAFLTISIAWNGAAVGTVLVYSSTVFTVVLGWFFFRESVTWAKAVAVATALLACIFVAGANHLEGWTIHPLGIISGIFSGVMYALYTLMGKASAQRGLNPWGMMAYIFGFAALFLMVFNGVFISGLAGDAPFAGDLLWLGGSFSGWGILLLLAAGPTVVGFGLYISSLGFLPAGVVNLVVMSETVFTAVIAYLFLGERFDEGQILGSLLLFAAVIFLRLQDEQMPLLPIWNRWKTSWMGLRGGTGVDKN
jgi:drug/metabolite transporter (DMT)-like permease